MIRRARLIAVLITLTAGAIGVISATQTWLTVMLAGGAQQTIDVAGAEAVPVLAPLSLAVLALGAALSIVGLVLRIAFGVLTVLVALALAVPSTAVAVATPVSAVATAVTAATGIAGDDAIGVLVASITATPWPGVTLAACVILLIAGVFTLVTAAGWRGSGRRYRSDSDGAPGAKGEADAAAAASRPFDAVDSWDDLSRGGDPTADPSTGPR